MLEGGRCVGVLLWSRGWCGVPCADWDDGSLVCDLAKDSLLLGSGSICV